VALLLRSKGVTRVRPLAGGLEAWREQGYPLAPHDAPAGTFLAEAAPAGPANP
jgi:3-mercaptopyruvate sulfurtransferase SseA